MLPKELTKDIKDRLHSVRGQVEGLIRMLGEDQQPEKILVQFKAVQKALDKAHYLLLDEVFRKELALKIVEVADTCPGDCGSEDKIELIRQQFPTLELSQITQKMKEISTIAERLKRYQGKQGE